MMKKQGWLPWGHLTTWPAGLPKAIKYPRFAQIKLHYTSSTTWSDLPEAFVQSACVLLLLIRQLHPAASVSSAWTFQSWLCVHFLENFLGWRLLGGCSFIRIFCSSKLRTERLTGICSKTGKTIAGICEPGWALSPLPIASCHLSARANQAQKSIDEVKDLVLGVSPEYCAAHLRTLPRSPTKRWQR